MIKIFLTATLFILSNFSIYSQEYFKVEFDAFSPPVKEMLDNLEGKPAKNFMMKDLSGNDVSLSQYKGRKVVLWFWDDQASSIVLNETMEVFAQKNTTVVFLSLFNGPKSNVPQGSEQKTFKVLPNAAFLGEAVYDKELGTPRVYLINEQGINKVVLPETYVANTSDLINVVDNFLKNKIY